MEEKGPGSCPIQGLELQWKPKSSASRAHGGAVTGDQVEDATTWTQERQQGRRRKNELDQVLGWHQHHECLIDVQAERGVEQSAGTRGEVLLASITPGAISSGAWCRSPVCIEPRKEAKREQTILLMAGVTCEGEDPAYQQRGAICA